MVSCCKLLGVRFFVLEVRSWSGNDISVNLYQTNIILCSDKKDHSLSAKLSLSEVQVLAKRRYIHLVAPSGPGPQLSLLRESGAQDPTGPQAPQAAQMVGTRLRGLWLTLGPRGRNGREVHCHLKAWAGGQWVS